MEHMGVSNFPGEKVSVHRIAVNADLGARARLDANQIIMLCFQIDINIGPDRIWNRK